MISSTVETVHVRCTEQALVLLKLRQLQRAVAVVGPAHGKWSTIYDPKCLWDDDERAALAARLSGGLEAPALIVSLIKYNRLGLDLYVSGKHEIEYLLDLDPARGDPSPEKCDRAAKGVAEKLLPLSRAGTTLERLDRILRALDVSSGRMERNTAQSEENARQLEAILPALLATPSPEMSREDALQMVRAGHASTRRDYKTFMDSLDEELLKTLAALRDSARTMADIERKRGDERLTTKWEDDARECERWIAAGPSGARAGMQTKLDELESQTEAEVQEMIDYNRQAHQRHRKLMLARPAALREEAARLKESARPLRAFFVTDVFEDLCQLLEFDPRAATYFEPQDHPSYPAGFSESA